MVDKWKMKDEGRFWKLRSLFGVRGLVGVVRNSRRKMAVPFFWSWRLGQSLFIDVYCPWNKRSPLRFQRHHCPEIGRILLKSSICPWSWGVEFEWSSYLDPLGKWLVTGYHPFSLKTLTAAVQGNRLVRVLQPAVCLRRMPCKPQHICHAS